MVDVFEALNAADRIMDQIGNEDKNLKTLNLMILGKTGVGKSTLLNTLFGQKRVATGIGAPVSTDIVRIASQHLTIYDTPGLELSGDNSMGNLLTQVVSVINKQLEEGTIDDAIHCILYCVSATSHRFEQNEADFIRLLQSKIKSQNIPIFIVLTQAFNKADSAALRDHIASLGLKIKGIVPVLATEYYVDEDYTAKPRGISELARLISEAIPESIQSTFDAIQVVNIELKKKKARRYVAAAATAAAAIGAVPIPFSDATLIVPEQLGMMASITIAFGIPIDKAALTAILSATIGTGGTTLLGKTVVVNIIKLIPGAGSIIGGAISASTAAALTYALGEAYILVMTKVAQGEITEEFLKTQEGIKMVARIFKEQLSTSRDTIEHV